MNYKDIIKQLDIRINEEKEKINLILLRSSESEKKQRIELLKKAQKEIDMLNDISS